jgi:hypothetical protein
MGTILLIIGGIGMLVGGIGMLMAGFRESVLWGLGMLIIPVVSLIFVITHWEDAKKPFIIQIVGWLLFAAGMGLNHE